MTCETFKINTLQQYRFVVVLSKYNGKILLSRHKDRTTWETQGGHIEQGETPLEAAKRELYEESGAVEFDMEPLCDYWAGNLDTGAEGNGMVFVADIHKLGVLPENLTYEAITPVLFAKISCY